MVYNIFDKESSGGAVKSEIMLNQELADVLQESVKNPDILAAFLTNNNS